MNLTYLSLEEILRLHFQIIEDYGGSHGIREEGRLKSVIDAPKQEVFGAEQYPSLFGKAAAFLRNIIGDHPFSGGNKRTAVTVCGIFLNRNGKKLTASPEALEEFTLRVATERLDVEEIATWLEDNT